MLSPPTPRATISSTGRACRAARNWPSGSAAAMRCCSSRRARQAVRPCEERIAGEGPAEGRAGPANQGGHGDRQRQPRGDLGEHARLGLQQRHGDLPPREAKHISVVDPIGGVVPAHAQRRHPHWRQLGKLRPHQLGRQLRRHHLLGLPDRRRLGGGRRRPAVGQRAGAVGSSAAGPARTTAAAAGAARGGGAARGAPVAGAGHTKVPASQSCEPTASGYQDARWPAKRRPKLPSEPRAREPWPTGREPKLTKARTTTSSLPAPNSRPWSAAAGGGQRYPETRHEPRHRREERRVDLVGGAWPPPDLLEELGGRASSNSLRPW